METVTVAGTVTLNGALPAISSSCAEFGAAATVNFIETSSGDSFTAYVPCNSTTFAFSESVFPGTYRVTVSGGEGSNIPSAGYLEASALQVP